MRLGVIYSYDSQATNRKQGELPFRGPLPYRTPIGQLGVIFESKPAKKKKKIPPQTGGSSYFLNEKSPKITFFKIKTYNKI